MNNYTNMFVIAYSTTIFSIGTLTSTQPHNTTKTADLQLEAILNVEEKSFKPIYEKFSKYNSRHEYKPYKR